VGVVVQRQGKTARGSVSAVEIPTGVFILHRLNY
jgi:hypothetical protein